MSSLGADLGPGWVLAIDKGEERAGVVRSHIARAMLGAVQLSREATHNTRRNTPRRTLFTTDIGRFIFQPACSFDLDPLDTWAWNAIKRQMFTVRNRTSLKTEAAPAWAAVRSWRLLERLLRDWERSAWHRVAAKTDSLEL